MIKKVRRKFTLSAMAAMSFCTLLLIAAINLANYYQTDQNLRSVLEQMVDYTDAGGPGAGRADAFATEDNTEDTVNGETDTDFGAEFSPPYDAVQDADAIPDEDAVRGADAVPDADAVQDAAALRDADTAQAEDETETETDPGYELSGGDREMFRDGHGPMGRRDASAQYGNRYFSILIDENGDVKMLPGSSGLLSSDAVKALAQEALAKGTAEGYLKEYRYLISEGTDGTRAAFLDCSTDFDKMRSLLLISAIAGAAGLVMVYIFVYWMSGRAVEPLHESMEKQKQFITDAGHELKTPISVIATNMDVLEMDVPGNEFVASTKRQTRKLRDLVTHLISLSKLEEDGRELKITEFDLCRDALETAEDAQMMADFEGKGFQTQIPKKLMVCGDEASARQVLTILSENAVKYAKSQICLSVKPSGKWIVFETLNDWEKNVNKADLNRLFERFYRADTSRNRDTRQNGYGLGLAIAKAAMEKMHGKLEVTQEEDGQICFRACFQRTAP